MRAGQVFLRILKWIVPLFAVEVAALLLFPGQRTWLATLLGILTVMLGIVVGASFRAESQPAPAVRIAEVSAAELSGLQEIALAHGLRSIGSAPIGPRLNRARTHFLVLRPVRPRKRKGVPTVGCIALFYLGDGTARVGPIEMDRSSFDVLDHVDDPVRAAEIMEERAQARLYTPADSEGQPS